MGLGLTERVRAGLGTFEEWKRDRDADIARAGANIQARGDQLYRRAIRTGQEMAARTPFELREFVKTAATVGLPAAAAVATVSQVARRPPGSSNASQRRPPDQQKPTFAQQLLANADRIKAEAKQKGVEALERVATDPHAAKAIGDLAEKAGQATGAIKSGLQTAEDIKDGAIFASRVVNPFDVLLSPPGQSAREQAGRGIVHAIGGATERAKKVIEDPRAAVDGVVAAGRQMRRNLDPSATPAAPTITGEIRRRFDIGRNQGDLGMDAASLLLAGPSAKAASGAARLSNIGNVPKYIGQGFTAREAARLAQRYDGVGHHSPVPQRMIKQIKRYVVDGPLVRAVFDGPFNVVKGRDMSVGDFNEHHYGMDPAMRGVRLLRSGYWSGDQLGLRRYSLPERLWHGTPGPTKVVIGGTAVGAAGTMNEALRDENRQ